MIDKFRKYASFFYAQGANVARGRSNGMHSFICLGCLPEILDLHHYKIKLA